jgi:uncharacterized protein (TIGR00297 family)
VFAAAIGGIALRARALSRGGAAAAVAVGTLTHGFGGWPMTLVLLAFFIPSVGSSRIGRARKKLLTDIAKGGARDAYQVLANGGIATICGVIAGGPAGSGGSVRWYAAFAGAYAAATADTWGTELGTLVKHAPRSILTLRPIATGLSGGVTGPGSLAEVAGATWIGLVAAFAVRGIARQPACRPDRVGLAVAAGGVFGALVDSLAGATLQELRRCPACERACETNPHHCGTPTLLVRGLPGVSNDLVNAMATLSGAGVAFALAG